MFISHKYRAIFVHIQRTGGNSLQRIFEEHDPDLLEAVPIAPEKLRTKHCYISDIQSAVSPEIFDRYCKFTVVRNPFDRLVSWYSHLRGQPNREDAGILIRSDAGPGDPLVEVAARHESIGEQVRQATQTRCRTFAEFVRLPATTASGIWQRFYVNQLDYISLANGPAIDYVLRFESLSEDFSQLAAALGLSSRLPHRNRAARDLHYSNYYDHETRIIVESRFGRDCAAFGYRFDDRVE